MTNPFEELKAAMEQRFDLLEKMISGSPGSVPDEIIDRAELCKRLDITQTTAIAWQKKGKLPFLRIGKQIRYDWKKVLKAMETKKGTR